MSINIQPKFPSIFLRVALAVSYLWFSFDRLGLVGGPGDPHISWGDWTHFMTFASHVMSFLPEQIVSVLAITATIGELVFGTLLFVGYFTQLAAIGSGILAFFFALSMAISLGFESPLASSVFTVSAGSFLLAQVP